MAKTFDAKRPYADVDRCFGEVYEYQGEFWAEVIVFMDGSEQVTEQSPAMLSCEQGVTWLAKRGVALRPTLSAQMKAAWLGLHSKAMAMIPRFATRLANTF